MSKKVITSLILILITITLLIIAQNNLDSFSLRILNLCGIYVIFAVSMNLINGFTGQLALGHAGFIAVGAYSYSLLVMDPQLKEMNFFLKPLIAPLNTVHWPFLPALILAGLMAALAGFLVGAPALRLRGDYLAIATLGFGEIIRIIFTNTQSITNGSLGLKGIPAPDKFLFFSMKNSLMWWVWIAAIITVIFHFLLIDSSYGRAFKAIREDEKAAQAMGIALFKHKVMAMVISSFFAGIGGALLASLIGTIDPLMFRFLLTFNILLIVVVGGMGSISGSIISAISITILMEVLRALDQGFMGLPALPGLRMVVFALLLMSVVLFYPKGLMGNEELSWNKLMNLLKKPLLLKEVKK
ncbi:MAG: branched-chain amino acid transport system permease protein [Clostridia bacterium]|jgi:branched-chain amino acid transport system permease protein|nr:branched-chain amino acid transport system permease protein [Clostridia bacterium]